MTDISSSTVAKMTNADAVKLTVIVRNIAEIHDKYSEIGGLFMPNTKWFDLSPLQLGKYAEYYAKMEFASYGYDVYTSEVDDHGVDFVAKDTDTGIFYEVQVKCLLKSNYAYIPKDKIVRDATHLVCFLKFVNGQLPEVYIMPATVWNNPNAVFVDRNYDKPRRKSRPEWGISYSKKNKGLLEQYKAENYFKR